MPRRDGWSKEIEREATRAASGLQDLLEDLDARIARIVAGLDTKNGELVAGQARNLTRVRKQVIEAIKEIGVRPITSRTSNAVADAASKIGELVAKDLAKVDGAPDGFTFDADASRDIAAIANQANKDIAAIFGDYGAQMSREIAAATNGALDVERLIDKLKDKSSAAISRAMTLIDTAVSAGARTALMDTASEVVDEDGEPLMVYRYTGPSDDLTRDFCDEHLGQYLSQEYVDKTTNDQGLPMRSTCGGYNCRHSLSPVPVDLVPRGARIRR
jgi:hypothetical protein